MNFVSLGRLNREGFFGLLSLDHADPRLLKVVGHRQLRVAVVADVLLVLSVAASLVTFLRVVTRVLPLVEPGSSTFLLGGGVVRAWQTLLAVAHLLVEQLVDFDVAVVHHDTLGQIVLELVAFDDVELTVTLEPFDHLVHALLELIPVLLIDLHLGLGSRQVLVELLQVVMVVSLIELVLLRDLPQLLQDLLTKLGGLTGELLVHLEQVPVGAHATEQVVEEVVELIPEVVPDMDDIVTEGNFMLSEILPNFLVDDALSELDVFQAFLDFLLERSFEVELVHRVEGHHWMKKMVRVKALSANLFLALQAVEDIILNMASALRRVSDVSGFGLDQWVDAGHLL
mmetsp:Transcript_26368/g.40238  ORF Transcript_26368/g.40238 Transcript_26368/m.40238 type:complete len:342 (-) Transcript_26368:705-1730(-)